MDETWLTTEQLLHLAAEAGFPDITSRQLKRWRYECVLPSPSTRHLGWGKGTCSFYPPETGPRLLALCRLRQWFPHDMDAVRFLFWLEGYSIQMEVLKYSLRQLLAPFSQLLPPDIADPLAAAEQVVQKALPNLRRSKWGRKAKRALGNEAEISR